jgi:hypothetical protein
VWGVCNSPHTSIVEVNLSTEEIRESREREKERMQLCAFSNHHLHYLKPSTIV